MTREPSTKNIAEIHTNDSTEMTTGVLVLLTNFLMNLDQDYVSFQTTESDTLRPGEIKIHVTDIGDIKQARKLLTELLTELTFEPLLNESHIITLRLCEVGLVTTNRMIECSWNRQENCFGPVHENSGDALPEAKARPKVDTLAAIGHFDGIDANILDAIAAKVGAKKDAARLL